MFTYEIMLYVKWMRLSQFEFRSSMMIHYGDGFPGRSESMLVEHKRTRDVQQIIMAGMDGEQQE